MTATPPNIAGRADCARRARRRRNGAGIAAASVLVIATLAAFASISPAVAEVLAPGTDDPARPAPPVEYALPWHWPVPAPIRVVEPFRAPATPYAAGHRGVDLQAEPGATVVAPGGGVVSFAGSVAGRGVVAIDHGDGVVSAIEPLDAAATATAGTTVIAGDVIGTVSAGGHCDARCVHFGVRVHGEYVSPFLFLGGLQRAVLLPAAE